MILDSIWIGTSIKTLLKKSLVEIFTVGIFVNSTSMISRGVCQGDKTLLEILQHVQLELPTVTQNDICRVYRYVMEKFAI